MQRSERERTDVALTRVAIVLAEAAQQLVTGCTAAVVAVELGSEWRMLAQRGPQDISSCWRQMVADHDRGVDAGCGSNDPLVIPYPWAGFRATLVVVPLAGSSLPADVREIVRPLVEAGGVLLGVAGSAAPSDRGPLRLVAEYQAPGKDV